jgi:hypothetical protein
MGTTEDVKKFGCGLIILIQFLIKLENRYE